MAYEEKGEYFKRKVLTISKERDIPVCRHCFTPSDYVPPPATAQLFPHNPNPYVAYEDYPVKVLIIR
jgi:hypothetical protein